MCEVFVTSIPRTVDSSMLNQRTSAEIVIHQCNQTHVLFVGVVQWMGQHIIACTRPNKETPHIKIKNISC